ncbi:MAG: hypothetical protein EXR76_06740 [Myxococcales bacterium]|nr:hypothetical protein [Myxococcales bacterium]
MKTRNHALVSAALATLPGLAAAATPHESAGFAKVGLVLTPKIGVGIHQVFSPLETAVLTELELGYTLPLPAPLNRDLQVLLSGGYTSPKAQGTGDPDGRLPGGLAPRFQLEQSQAHLTIGALYRIPLPTQKVRPFVALGLRTFMIETVVTGSAGEESFGQHTETGTDVGLYSALGLDYFFEPFAVMAEVQLDYAGQDRRVMTDTGQGGIVTLLGVRLFL